MVEIMGIGVLIEGPPGMGKSETALALIRRGAALVSDDITALRRDSAGSIIGAPVNVTRYHMEIRGLGIINVADPAAQAEVDNVGRSLRRLAGGVGKPGGVTDGLDKIVGCAATYPENAQGHHACLPPRTGHAASVVAEGGDGTGNVGAVKTAVHLEGVARIAGVVVFTVAVIGHGSARMSVIKVWINPPV